MTDPWFNSNLALNNFCLCVFETSHFSFFFCFCLFVSCRFSLGAKFEMDALEWTGRGLAKAITCNAKVKNFRAYACTLFYALRNREKCVPSFGVLMTKLFFFFRNSTNFPNRHRPLIECHSPTIKKFAAAILHPHPILPKITPFFILSTYSSDVGSARRYIDRAKKIPLRRLTLISHPAAAGGEKGIARQ